MKKQYMAVLEEFSLIFVSRVFAPAPRCARAGDCRTVEQ